MEPSEVGSDWTPQQNGHLGREDGLIDPDPYRQLFEMAPDPICTVDHLLRFQQVNPAWESVLGWALDELRAQPLLPFVHPDDHDKTEAVFARLLTGDSSRAEFTNRCRHANGTWVSLAWAVRSREGICYCTVRGLSGTRSDADRLKSEFVSTVSHELRTPLTTIRGALGLVAKGITGQLPAQAQECVDIALANSERLVTLINDLLDMEKIQSVGVELNLRPANLAGLIATAVEEAKALTDPLDVRLSFVHQVPDIEVLVDEDRLKQVLANLISNAAKFSAPGQCVEVSMLKRGDQIRAQVCDHGRGVSEEYRAHIFGNFSQEDSSDTRRKGGTGLGLHISKALIEGMNGTIGFESVPHRRTIFFFDLPIISGADAIPVLPKSNARQDASCGSPPPMGEKRIVLAGRDIVAQQPIPTRVLYVEDDQDLHDIVKRLLPRDWAVTDAMTVADAKALLGAEKFDLVLLDLALPDGGGEELLDHVGAAQVVIFSASEAAPALAGRVSSALVKSRTTEFELRDRVVALMGAKTDQRTSE